MAQGIGSVVSAGLEIMEQLTAFAVLPLLTAIIHKASVLLGALPEPGGYLLGALAPNLNRLREIASRIYSRMRSMRMNETELSERCCLASVQLFENSDAPFLTRDRIAKILMNRNEMPAKSAARVISDAELIVLARVLQVPTEWLIGQKENKDPVVWNVLAEPDRGVMVSQLLHEYEEVAKQTTIWTLYPSYVVSNPEFTRTYNEIVFNQRTTVPHARSLVEFYTDVARIRRKWVLRNGRGFEYTNLIFKSDFEEVVTGQGLFSSIPRTALARNIQVMIETLSNEELNINLVIVDDSALEPRVLSRMRDYQVLATTGNLFSFWIYHNGDVGWSEHAAYVRPHHDLLKLLGRSALFGRTEDTLEFIRSLRDRFNLNSREPV
jgi:hypothetical protein